ncbi:MAG: nucleotidyltransferase domain-containing protein [Pseudomonadota bacterium]|uniref:Nucleotidyltransferase domain-containing protein n=1 Tax=Candidatus Desulfatibia profunda TaxID=2841695 RepID=A0A8J6TJ08_9BACT|nr:nucleotidyltransferase domain-containing protein [Candidatus Desulfatibia profunda]MBL7179538.1 nucleotidyltransferase domain-containing protein [Desulfobacterales bacterium]
MEQSEILIKLEQYKKNNQGKYRFSKIGIFGSVAKGTAGEKSDIDIVIEQKEPDLFLLGTIKTDLEDEFGRKVDIIRIRKEMNVFLRKRIEQEAIYV